WYCAALGAVSLACCWLGDGWVMVGLVLEMGLVIASDAWRSKAQVLLPAAAPLAHPAGPAEPRHADAIGGRSGRRRVLNRLSQLSVPSDAWNESSCRLPALG